MNFILIECEVIALIFWDYWQVHFRRIIAVHTDVNLGDCSFLDTCRHMKVTWIIHSYLWISFMFEWMCMCICIFHVTDICLLSFLLVH